MDYRSFHPEDVKAAIRKRFGSLAKFELMHGLARESVSDVLRGRTSARVASVVNAVMALESTETSDKLSDIPDNMPKRRRLHRLNAEAA